MKREGHRRTAALVAAAVSVAAVLMTPSLISAAPRIGFGLAHTTCSSGYVDGVIGGEHKCLRAGEFCSPSSEADYERYGFSCVDGRLRSGVSAPAPATTTTVAPPVPAPVASTTTTTTVSPPGVLSLGHTVVLAARTKTSGCRQGVLPDRRCSPGAYYSGLTKTVICSASFRTGTVRSVPTSEKYAVEREYGMGARSYGRTIEIDHIVSLELGGSNDLANLFPEPGSGPANYHEKDKLENALHDRVCTGQITLSAARRGIATNWVTLYKQVFGAAP